MTKYYYFALANGDPTRSSFKENEFDQDELRTKFIGEWVRTGDEEHDFDRVVDIWTSAQVNAYYNG